jgi:uncharacterized protein (DUF2235 family)
MSHTAPKRLVICCDGTWNTPAQTDRGRLAPTNVVRLARALEDDFDRPGAQPLPADGYRQKIYYDQGVGTGNFAAPVAPGFPGAGLRRTIRSLFLAAQRWDKHEGFRVLPLVPRQLMRWCAQLDAWVGGATGAGLVENVYNAYQFLVDNYNPGDEIFLFGFSRGAYTVRSLAGMLYKCGLVRREPCELLASSTASGKGRTLTCQEACLPLCPACQNNRDRIIEVQQAYQARKQEKRENKGKEASQQKTTAQQALHALRAEYADPVKIKMVGVWDTVGALGIPKLFSFIPDKFRHCEDYSFLDTSINDDIQYAYQALALDERRQLFTPALWAARPPASAFDTNGEPTLHQVWFAGVHSNVGGGYDDTGLADISLGWMMCWAEKRGLRFQRAYRQRLFPDHFGELRDSIDTTLGKLVYRASPRLTTLQHQAGLPLIHYTVFDKHRRGIVAYASPLPVNWQEGVHYRICNDAIEPVASTRSYLLVADGN